MLPLIPLAAFTYAAAPSAGVSVGWCIFGIGAGVGAGAGGGYFGWRYWDTWGRDWWYRQQEMPEDDPINQQLGIVKHIKTSVDQIETELAHKSHLKTMILTQCQLLSQHSEETETQIAKATDLACMATQTFESLLTTLINGPVGELGKLLTVLEHVKHNLSFDQQEIIKLVLQTIQENQSLRESNHLQEVIIAKFEKINYCLRQKLLQAEEHSIEEKYLAPSLSNN